MERSLRSKKRRPTHPGAILREDVLPELRLSQAGLAKRLGVSRRVISEIVNEQRSVTPDMALRLARFLGTTPDSWLNMQQAVDTWDTEHGKHVKYECIKPWHKSELQLAI
jgi:addiction module HigA family antidote